MGMKLYLLPLFQQTDKLMIYIFFIFFVQKMGFDISCKLSHKD